jgi:chemotaxis protein MotB
MSLLMAFFVMLVAFSTQDQRKLQIVAGSMRDAFGVNPMPKYVGRVASASPATGAYESHEIEQSALVRAAFSR